MNGFEPRTIFREMARAELRIDSSPARRERRLLAYAAKLGIERAEAAELLQEARRSMGLPDAAAGARGLRCATSGREDGSPSRLAIVTAALAIGVVVLLLMRMT